MKQIPPMPRQIITAKPGLPGVPGTPLTERDRGVVVMGARWAHGGATARESSGDAPVKACIHRGYKAKSVNPRPPRGGPVPPAP